MTTAIEPTARKTLTLRDLSKMLDEVRLWIDGMGEQRRERELRFGLGEPQTFKDSASGVEMVRHHLFIWRRTEMGAYCEQLDLEVWQ